MINITVEDGKLVHMLPQPGANNNTALAIGGYGEYCS